MFKPSKNHFYKILVFLILFCILNFIYRYRDEFISLKIPLSHFRLSNYNGTTIIKKICILNTSNFKSEIPVDRKPYPFEELEGEDWAKDIEDGYWTPSNCKTNTTVAIIIPYRNRLDHLKLFLKHMHPFLQKQLISYQISIIEQAEGTSFNRAALFNAGFKILTNSSKYNFNCFIFHDVDLLPSNNFNFYKCSSNPIHLSVAIDKFGYKLMYASLFGGAIAMSKEQFLKVNGFSNIFFGWGGEDDDMSSRVRHFYKIFRYPNNIARYIMVKHNRDKGNSDNPERFRLLRDTTNRYKIDGISTAVFTIHDSQPHSRLYHQEVVQFPEKEILKKWFKIKEDIKISEVIQ